MAKFNYREIARAVAKSPAGRKRIETFARQRFEVAKNQLMEDFDNHPVTRELEAGAQDPENADNVSNTLPGSSGNLYSFIGFEENPIPALRNALQEGTTLSVSTISVEGDKIKCKSSLRVATEQIQDATPLPFETGKSWAEGIEKGISGFSQFLAGAFATSRSGGGIQVKNQVRGQNFRTTQYLSQILKNFTNKLRKKQ